jgi:hypothetical protein
MRRLNAVHSRVALEIDEGRKDSFKISDYI